MSSASKPAPVHAPMDAFPTLDGELIVGGLQKIGDGSPVSVLPPTPPAPQPAAPQPTKGK